MKFYLGTHRPYWLKWIEIPIFVSRRELAKVVTLPEALGEWALDSGGFSELSIHGKWTIDYKTYITEVRKYKDEIGNLVWAAAQDWMCEPFILNKTGLSVKDHQRKTIENYLDLINTAPDLPWCPVLQGWQGNDYIDHIDQYLSAGIDLSKLPIVGIGSVCRRQHTEEVEGIIKEIYKLNIPLHGFGFKQLGLRRVADYLTSADSMAWSLAARKDKPIKDCSHSKCNNCIKYAIIWRSELLHKLRK